MKKLLSLFSMAAIMAFAISCGDDDEPTPAPSFDAPSVTASGVVPDAQVGGDGVANFEVTVDSDLSATAAVTTTGGITAATTSAADVSTGAFEVAFTANTAGAASITLTVTDSEGQKANATHVFNVVGEGDNLPTIEGIPATATIDEGDVLTVAGPITLTSDDGFASSNAFTLSIDGGAAQDLGVSGDATSPVSLTDVDLPTADLDAGTYEFVFTLTDADGDIATATHILIVEADVTEVPTVDVFASAEGTGSVTWTKDNVYILRGFVFVNEGQTLTIEPGTIIKGQPGEGAGASALIVARGGTINAVGTATEPIIFTSLSDELAPADIAAGNFGSPNLTPTQNGRWGGLIVLGNARISAANDDDQDVSEAQIEGIPASEERGLYGGTDDADDSGDISYVSIRHGGSLIGAGNEINGLTLGGVGTGTSISNIEVVANQDDGVEWFGGNVSITNLLVWNSGDDAVDTDQDWIGTLDNFIVVTPVGGSAFELDGPEGSLNRGCHTIINGTVYAGSAIDHLVDWDGSTNAGLEDIYFYGWDATYPPAGFDAIESFGGDGNCTTDSWEYTLTTGGLPVDSVFNDVPAAALTEVAQNANTGGADASVFGWTWASQSGSLAAIGIE